MAMSLGFHIVFAVVGMALPVLMAMAEWRWMHTGNEACRLLAQQRRQAFERAADPALGREGELGLARRKALWADHRDQFHGMSGLAGTLDQRFEKRKRVVRAVAEKRDAHARGW